MRLPAEASVINQSRFLTTEWRIYCDDAERLLAESVTEAREHFKRQLIPRSGPAIKGVYVAAAKVISELVTTRLEPFIAGQPTQAEIEEVRPILEQLVNKATSAVLSYALFTDGYEGVARVAVDRNIALLRARIELPLDRYCDGQPSSSDDAILEFAESGVPGRPSGKQIWFGIFEERIKNAECCKDSLASEAQIVAEMYNGDRRYNNWPRVTEGTVKNAIRKRYNQDVRPQN